MKKQKIIKTLSLVGLLFMLTGSLTSCGEKGDTGAQGETGEKGDPGETGKTGADGEDGTDGTNGIDGLNGLSVLTGSDAPLATLGVNGDSYIDTKTWDYYVKKSDVWTKIGNIKGDTGVGEAGEDGKNGTSILTGEGEPSVALGNDNDSYVDLTKWIYYVKEDGVWVSKGSFKGSMGRTGATGAAGVAGKDGKAFLTGSTIPASTLGNEGDSYINTSTWDFYLKTSTGWGDSLGKIKGNDGFSLLTGSTIPDSNLGKVGDSYINTTNWDFYVKTSTGWGDKLVNLKGTDGNNVLTGTTIPADTLGKNGDSYINTSTWDYYVKADGTWGTVKGNIKGDTGTSVLTGTGEPANSLGINGDSYINTSTWDYYVKENNAWSNKGNIKGAVGAIGDKGQKGDNGAVGNVGPSGPQGEKGDTGAPGETAYASTILPSDYGYVTTSVGSAVVGGAVTFNFYPDDGYTLKSVKINNVEKYDGVTGDDKVVADGDAFKYSTIMIKNGFVVQAEFDKPFEFPVPVSSVTSAIVGDHIYVFGGDTNDGTSNSIYDINASNKHISLLTTVLPEKLRAMCCVAYNTHIYLFSGQKSNNDANTTVYDFDTTSKTFDSTHQITITNPVLSPGCSISGNNILLFGGSTTSQNNYDTIQYFTIGSDYAITQQSNPTVVCSNAGDSIASSVVGSDYYLFGGMKVGTSTRFSGVQKFSVSGTTISKTSDFSFTGSYGELNGISATTVGTHIYLFGGYGSGSFKDTIYDFDSNTNTIVKLDATLKSADAFISSVAYGNYIYLFNVGPSYAYSKEVHIFDTVNKVML